METQSRNVLVAESENFKVWVELADNKTALLHCEFLKLTPSILKECYRIFVNIENQAREAGYSQLMTVTPNPKFAKLFGGTTTAFINHMDKEFEVIVWDLHT